LRITANFAADIRDGSEAGARTASTACLARGGSAPVSGRNAAPQRIFAYGPIAVMERRDAGRAQFPFNRFRDRLSAKKALGDDDEAA